MFDRRRHSRHGSSRRRQPPRIMTGTHKAWAASGVIASRSSVIERVATAMV